MSKDRPTVERMLTVRQSGVGKHKLFHYFVGRESLCGIARSDTRNVAPFPPGSERGRVHHDYGCPRCGEVLIAIVDEADHETEGR